VILSIHFACYQAIIIQDTWLRHRGASHFNQV